MFLELLPATGPLLARAGAAYVAGWLVQICLLAAAVDAARGALPRPVAVVPLLAYAGYWSAVWEQGRRVELTSEALQQSNPGVVLAFDPDKHALVTDGAEDFAVSHVIPVVYARDRSHPQGFRSYRTEATGLPAKVEKGAGNGWEDASAGAGAATDRLIVTASVSDHPGDIWKDWGIGVQTIEVAVKGAPFGVFRSAYVDRLPPLPFIAIGCAYAGSGSRQCSAGFVTQRLIAESRPRSVDRALYDDGLSVMLHIAVRSEKDPVRTHAIKLTAGTESPSEPGTAEDAAFAELDVLIKGGETELSSRAAQIVANNPSRLEPLAPRLVSRFLELRSTKPAAAPGVGRNLSRLATAISALGPGAFSAVEERLAPLIGELPAYPLLYLRMADAGGVAYPHYRDRVMSSDGNETELLLSILGICRLGFADDELMTAMKSKLEASRGAYANPALVSAILATMMKLGQARIAAEISPLEPDWLRTWRSQLLSGNGRADIGPNNCMPAEWPLDQDVPPVMAPRLVWVRGGWATRPDPSARPIRASLN